MDSLVQNLFLSPTGEVSSRLEDPNASLFDIDTIELTLEKVLGLPKNGVGLVACVNVLLRDMKLCSGEDVALQQWEIAFQQLKSRLEICNTESQDRILVGRNASRQAKLLLVEFGNHFSRESKLQIRQIRTKLLLHHVCRRQQIPERLAVLFVSLLAGRSQQSIDLAANLAFDRKVLSLLRASFEPESDFAELMTSLISAIDTPISSPPTLSPQQIAPIVHTTHEFKLEAGDTADDVDTATSNTDDQEPNHSKETVIQDVIGNLLWETEHARPRDFSGISNLWDFLQPSELESAVRKFSEDINGEYRQESLASLLAISTRTRPKEYRSIPLNETPSHSLWIDPVAGHIAWKFEAVIDRERWRKQQGIIENRAPVRIPLPEEVSSRLKVLLSTNPTATNLGELFGGHLAALDSSTKRYLKNISTCSHRLTLGRLTSSFSRYVLHICQDEAYSSLLGIDFRIGTPSNFNYCSFRANRINSILREAYLKLGLSGAITDPVSTDVGSRFLGAMSSVDIILKDSLQDALSSYEHVKRKFDATSISAAHNTISASVLRAMCITTGHRESDRHSFATHTIDLASGLALISDKAVSPYHHIRLVPIPSIITNWIRFYREWLAHIRYRYLSLDHHVSKYVDSILVSTNKRADGSMFFSLTPDGKIRGLKNADIAERFSDVGLEANAGRHWVENILREASQDSAVIMAWAGHSAIGQEAFGIRSALDPMTACDSARNTINQHLDSLNLPCPPSLHSRKAERKFEHKHDFTPGGFGNEYDNLIGNLIGLEECPFLEMTLAHSRQFMAACSKWLTYAPDKSIGNLSINLIVNDGIINNEELVGATSEVAWGKIHKNANNYFADSVTNGLGIRRVWLSLSTVTLSAQIEVPRTTDSAMTSLIADAAASLLSNAAIEWQGCPLEHLLCLARAFYSLRLPGVLRGWMFGDIHARTSRPETVARHHFNLVEHPRIERIMGRLKSRQDSSDKFITELIIKEADTTEYRGREATRLKALHSSLSDFENLALDSGALEVKLHFAIYLSKSVDSPSTVKRYFYALRHFIEDVCSMIDSLDDITEIEWMEPVNEFRNLRVAVSENGQDPALAALNHFLRCFGIDLITIRKSDLAAAARRYADYPSHDEVMRAIDRLPIISSLPPPRTDQAILALKTMAATYLRWFEVSRLRVSDVSSPEQATMVISHEAVGTHKSSNADRIHCGMEQRLARELSQLTDMRNKQFGFEADTFIFCDSDNSQSVSQSDELRRQISDSLWSATGSDNISPHSTRRVIPIARYKEHLCPESRLTKSPLALRQFMYYLAGLTGHGDPLTTVSHYICELDELRQQWVAHQLSKSNLCASSNFLSSIINIRADTLRARSRRNSKLSMNSIVDDFDFSSYPAFQSRLRNLSDYLVGNTTTLDVAPRTSKHDFALSCSIYVASGLLGVDRDVAKFVSQIDEPSMQRLDRGLSVLSSGLGKTWLSNVPVSTAALLHDELFLRVTQQFSELNIPIASALAISRSIVQPDSAWVLTSIDDASMISNVLGHISRTDVATVISRPKSKGGDYKTFAIFPANSYQHTKLDSRWFPRDNILRIQFIPAGLPLSALPATTPITTFLISSILISKCALTLGGSNE